MIDINCVIFSKNRAMQLDALLRSMDRYAPWLGKPTVIFNSDDPHDAAYDWMGENSDCDWAWDGCGLGFKGSVVEVAKSSDLTHLAFLVDDDLFYRPLPEFTVEPGTAYAPRLGWNATYCYTINKPQQVPTQLWRDVGGEGDLDFDATFSVDGHVYRTDEILPHLESASYNNPNELECELSSLIRPRLKFAEHSCLVGIPHNRVGPNTWNRHAGGSAEELNEMFLDGWRIDLDAMDFSNVTSVHQEIEYKFKRTA